MVIGRFYDFSVELISVEGFRMIGRVVVFSLSRIDLVIIYNLLGGCG